MAQGDNDIRNPAIATVSRIVRFQSFEYICDLELYISKSVKIF